MVKIEDLISRLARNHSEQTKQSRVDKLAYEKAQRRMEQRQQAALSSKDSLYKTKLMLDAARHLHELSLHMREQGLDEVSIMRNRYGELRLEGEYTWSTGAIWVEAILDCFDLDWITPIFKRHDVDLSIGGDEEHIVGYKVILPR